MRLKKHFRRCGKDPEMPALVRGELITEDEHIWIENRVLWIVPLKGKDRPGGAFQTLAPGEKPEQEFKVGLAEYLEECENVMIGLSPDATQIVLGTERGRILLLSRANRTIHPLESRTRLPTTCIAFSKEGNLIVCQGSQYFSVFE